ADATDLPGMSDVLPRAMKNLRLLSLKYGVIDVPSRGQRRSLFERTRERRLSLKFCRHFYFLSLFLATTRWIILPDEALVTCSSTMIFAPDRARNTIEESNALY